MFVGGEGVEKVHAVVVLGVDTPPQKAFLQLFSLLKLVPPCVVALSSAAAYIESVVSFETS